MISSRHVAQSLFELLQESPKDKHSKIIKNFFGFIDHHRAQHLFSSIFRHFEQVTKIEEHTNTLFVKSAYELPKDVCLQIAKHTHAEESPFQQSTDPDLIGGFIAEYKGKRFDASLRYQLQSLRENLTR